MTPGTGVLFDLTPGLEKEIRRSLSQVRRSKEVEGGRLVVGVPVPVGRPVLLSWHPQAGGRVSISRKPSGTRREFCVSDRSSLRCAAAQTMETSCARPSSCPSNLK